jgi:hypothetical protein
VATGLDIDYLLGRAIPDALDPIVHAAVGDAIPRIGEGGRYRIAHTGRFSSRCAGDLLAFGRNQHLDGALVVIEADTTRALFFRKGRAVGAASDVLFERFGRVLARCEVVDEALARDLVGREETHGLAAAVGAVTPEIAAWALETRVWDIAAALFLVPSGHFVIVEGTPALDALPAIDISPTDLALEGMRRYDEWRNGPRAAPAGPHREPESLPPPALEPVAVPQARKSSAASDELLARLRELG